MKTRYAVLLALVAGMVGAQSDRIVTACRAVASDGLDNAAEAFCADPASDYRRDINRLESRLVAMELMWEMVADSTRTPVDNSDIVSEMQQDRAARNLQHAMDQHARDMAEERERVRQMNRDDAEAMERVGPRRIYP